MDTRNNPDIVSDEDVGNYIAELHEHGVAEIHEHILGEEDEMVRDSSTTSTRTQDKS